MGVAVIVAVVAFTLFGLGRFAEIMRRHRDHQDRAENGFSEAEVEASASEARTTVWFVVRAQDPREVARVLGLRTVQPVAFEVGMQRARTGMFVAPCGKAFVMAIGLDAWQRGDLSQVEAALVRLSKAHGEAFWFVVDEERSCVGWAMARRGELQRAFCFHGSDEEVLWEVGEPTQAERELGFFVEDPRDLTDDELKWWPLPRDVRSLAARWSIDPSRLSEPGQPGLAGRW